MPGQEVQDICFRLYKNMISSEIESPKHEI